MTRVKRGVTASNRHRKVLKLTRGQKGSKHLLFRRANEAMLKSLWYSYRDRRNRKRDFRRLWIARINAATRQAGISYSRFIQGLRQADIDVNRKMLAEIAATDQSRFNELVGFVKTRQAS